MLGFLNPRGGTEHFTIALPGNTFDAYLKHNYFTCYMEYAWFAIFFIYVLFIQYLSKFYGESAVAARPGNVITGARGRRHAAPPPAQPRARTKDQFIGRRFAPRHPRHGVLQGAAAGAGIGENRVAL